MVCLWSPMLSFLCVSLPQFQQSLSTLVVFEGCKVFGLKQNNELLAYLE